MPGLMTHYLFGTDTYNYIYDDRIKSIIGKHRDAYNLGLQGADFYFYDLSHSRKHRGFNYGRLIHTNQTNAFFANCLKGAAMMSGVRKEVALAYTYGLLCHFALDSCAHPYILYMACFKTDNDRDRQVSSASHSYFESAIDAQMLLLKRGLTMDKLRRQDLIDITCKKLNVVSHLFAYAFNKTFDQYTSADSVAKSIKNAQIVNSFLQDSPGVKIQVMQLFEKSVVKASLISGIMHSHTAKISWDVLNRANNVWCLPWDDTAKRTESFIDIYEDAAYYASKLINDADSIVNFNIKTHDFFEKLGNKSYITGVDCNQVCIMKHFRSKTKEIIQ